jgi:hypothetical protein
VPIIVAAIDPCMGCMDRVMLVKKEEQPGERISWDQLRGYANRWYAERGWLA